jgi:hypothetical protein
MAMEEMEEMNIGVKVAELLQQVAQKVAQLYT